MTSDREQRTTTSTQSLQTDPERIAFWEDAARRLEWARPWDTAHTWIPADVEADEPPVIRWFEGGRLNAAVNYVDRHVAAGRGDKVALYERYGVTSYYTAPTLVRSLMGWFPDGVPTEYDFSSVRVCGTVGEAVNPEAWRWLRENIGRGEVPMVDTWWQSETGACVLSTRPSDAVFKPGCATRALPGLATDIVDDDGARVAPGVQGNIVVTATGPAMARTVWGNPQRYLDPY